MTTRMSAGPSSVTRYWTVLPMLLVEMFAPVGHASAQPSGPDSTSCAVTAQAGYAAYQEGSRPGLEQALRLFVDGIRCYERAGMWKEAGSLLNNLGAVYLSLEQPDSARAVFHRGYVIAAGRNDSVAQAQALNGLGVVFQFLGQLDSATLYLGRAYELHRAANDADGAAHTLVNLGATYSVAEQWDSAAVYLRRAYRDVLATGDSTAALSALLELGKAYRNLPQRDSARRVFRRAAVLARALGDGSSRAEALGGLGSVFGDEAQHDSAVALHHQAARIAAEAGARSAEAVALGNLGSAFADWGRSDSAVVYLRQALMRFRRLREPDHIAGTLYNLGTVWRDLARPDSALVYFDEAQGIYGDLQAGARQRTVLTSMAAIHRSAGRSQLALQYYRKALAATPGAGSDELAGIRAAIAELFEVLGQQDSAAVYRGQNISDDLSSGDTSRIVAGLLARVYQLRERGDLRAALEAVERASALGGILSDSLQGAVDYTLGGVLLDLGRFAEARERLTGALRTFERLGQQENVAPVLNELGALEYRAGQPEAARAYLLRARALLDPADDSGDLARTLLGMGALEHDAGALSDASALFEEAFVLCERTSQEDCWKSSLHNLASVQHSLGRPDSALSLYERAQASDRLRRDRRGEATTLSAIGRLHLDNDSPLEALVAYAAALDLWRSLRDSVGIARTLNSVAMLYSSIGRPDTAIVILKEVLELNRRLGLGPNAAVLNNLATLYQDVGRPDSALAYLRLAVAASASLNEFQRIAILGNLGVAHHRWLSPPALAQAVAYYDSAAALRTAARRRAGRDPDQTVFAGRGAKLTQEWVLAWLGRRAEVGERDGSLAALAAAERGRAQALLDAALDTVRLPKPGEDLVAEGARFAAVIQRSRTTALYYLVTRDTLVIWLGLPSGAVQVFTEPVSSDSLAAHVAALRSALGTDFVCPTARPPTGLPADFTAELRWLARHVLPSRLRSFLPESGELLIIPNGALNYLPFSALVVDASGEPLGVRFALRYSPSLALLKDAGAHPEEVETEERRRPTTALIVGNPTMPRVEVCGIEFVPSQLTRSAESALEVARALGVQPLTGDEASEARVKERLPRAGLVMFATHGYAYSSESRARESFILLGSGSGSGRTPRPDDGRLTVGEIFDLGSLSAELIVLSACQTGLGEMNEAEGFVGLQRAFLAQHARSLLVSLWEVPDAATAQLTAAFFRFWLAGTGKGEALRLAQAEVRRTWPHPRHWAGFILVGAP
jgi:tetratricopeptide (TPR) repeat protein